GEQPVVGGKREDHPLASHVELETVRRHAAPIGEIPAGQRRDRLVFGGADGTCQQRATPVSAYHPGGVFRYALPAANTCDALAVADVVRHHEIVAQLDTGLDRSVDQHLVERGAAGSVAGGNAVDYEIPTGQPGITHVEGDAGGRRAAGCDDAVEQAP